MPSTYDWNLHWTDPALCAALTPLRAKTGRSTGSGGRARHCDSNIGTSRDCRIDIEVRNPSGMLSGALPRDDAYMISLTISGVTKNCYWQDGRQVSSKRLNLGQFIISDATRKPRVLTDSVFHSVLFYLTDQADAPRVDELRYEPGGGISDETVKHLCLSLMPAFRAPDQANRLH